MSIQIIDMKGAAGSFEQKKIESFKGAGRVEFIGQCADVLPDGRFNATATELATNIIQVRGVSGSEKGGKSAPTPWTTLRRNDRFHFPNHSEIEFNYQAKENGVIILLTGPLGDLSLTGKGAYHV